MIGVPQPIGLPAQLFVGVQNDYPYLIDRQPAQSNDHPNHEADRELVAKPFGVRGTSEFDIAAALRDRYNAHMGLVLALASVQIDGPDGDGLLWLRIEHPEIGGKAAFNLGKADNKIVAQVAQLFEQIRREALAKAGVK